MPPDVGRIHGIEGLRHVERGHPLDRRMPDHASLQHSEEAAARPASAEPPRDRVTVGETSARFEVDPVARRVVLKVLDDRTGEVIRQVPPEEVLAAAKVLDQIVPPHAKGGADRAETTG